LCDRQFLVEGRNDNGHAGICLVISGNEQLDVRWIPSFDTYCHDRCTQCRVIELFPLPASMTGAGPTIDWCPIVTVPTALTEKVV
jgi:hypothetical protein